jgi:glycolate oxidase FAD binding subunit
MTSGITTAEEICQAVRALSPGARLLPVAGNTKPALSRSERHGVLHLDISGLSGIVDYNPAELTLTALAGTPIAEIASTLAEHGQYLPFDPPLALAGATLGGAVAAGASGANALRHGGIRSFVLGVQFVDGLGALVAAGGRVVKNAAGFDLPKLMVGSMGRLGVMTQLSVKVFPSPAATATIEFTVQTIRRALDAVVALATGPIQLEALDVTPEGTVLARLGGPADTLGSRLVRLQRAIEAPVHLYRGDLERELWAQAGEFRWVPRTSAIIRVGVSPGRAVQLDTLLAGFAGTRVRYAIAGTSAFIAWPQDTPLNDLNAGLRTLKLRGLLLRGTADHPRLGPSAGGEFAIRVARAIDPRARFLEL